MSVRRRKQDQGQTTSPRNVCPCCTKKRAPASHCGDAGAVLKNYLAFGNLNFFFAGLDVFFTLAVDVFFGAAVPARRAAHRAFIIAAILARPSGLILLFFFAFAGFPALTGLEADPLTA